MHYPVAVHLTVCTNLDYLQYCTLCCIKYSTSYTVYSTVHYTVTVDLIHYVLYIVQYITLYPVQYNTYSIQHSTLYCNSRFNTLRTVYSTVHYDVYNTVH